MFAGGTAAVARWLAALNVGVPASAMSAVALKALAPLRRAAMELSLQL